MYYMKYFENSGKLIQKLTSHIVETKWAFLISKQIFFNMLELVRCSLFSEYVVLKTRCFELRFKSPVFIKLDE